jgi:hypothetical protein
VVVVDLMFLVGCRRTLQLKIGAFMTLPTNKIGFQKKVRNPANVLEQKEEKIIGVVHIASMLVEDMWR